MLGILLIDKPQGPTSHDVVAHVRRTLRTKRVGHAGTLDPQATGLLVVAVGPATRFLQYLPLEPKDYVAEVTFGVATTTYDGEGVITQESPVPGDLEPQLAVAIPRFRGLIEQLPPMYSAVKRAGKPLYEYARKGEEVERAPRTVHLETVHILGVEPPIVRLRVVCSGGTYVRTLAHDLGREVGCGAYLSGLVREGVGRFRLDRAVPLEAVSADALIPLGEALPPMPILRLDRRELSDVRHGQPVLWRGRLNAKHVALADAEGEVVGVASVADGQILNPECVIPAQG